MLSGSTAVYWYFPERDGVRPWLSKSSPSFSSRLVLAKTLERHGFDGGLITTGPATTDPWVLAAALAARTKKIKFIVAQYPFGTSPRTLVDKVQTFNSFFPARLILNLVMGSAAASASHQQPMGHDERYQKAEEFWQNYLELSKGSEADPSRGYLHVMTGGGSKLSLEFAARYAHTWLSLGEPVAQLADQVTRLRAVAHLHNREVECGVRLNVVLRSSAQVAWRQAQIVFDELKETSLSREPQNDREGAKKLYEQFRERYLKATSAHDLQLEPGLWAGYFLFRGGPGTAIVGGPAEIRALLARYRSVGVQRFILGGYPHLREASRFGSLLLDSQD